MSVRTICQPITNRKVYLGKESMCKRTLIPHCFVYGQLKQCYLAKICPFSDNISIYQIYFIFVWWSLSAWNSELQLNMIFILCIFIFIFKKTFVCRLGDPLLLTNERTTGNEKNCDHNQSQLFDPFFCSRRRIREEFLRQKLSKTAFFILWCLSLFQ